MKISFLISAYNDGLYLDRRIRNILHQTNPDFEIIIIDPKSEDDTKKIASSWCENDPRIRYYYQSEKENYGISWLKAWEYAEAEYVCNANCDDLYDPLFSELMLQYFDSADNKIGFAYPGIVITDERRQIIGQGSKPPFDREVFKKECYGGPSVMWRNKLIKEIDYDVAVHRAQVYHTAFDYWLWLKFMSLGYDGLSVPYLLLCYTQRKQSIENSSGRRSTWQSLSSIGEFFPDTLREIGNDHALNFLEWPWVPPEVEWCEATKDGSHWTGEKVNILEIGK